MTTLDPKAETCLTGIAILAMLAVILGLGILAMYIGQ